MLNACDTVDLATVRDMTDIIAHRGPDGDGHWVSNDKSVGLGHRRLAIIDLSDGGKQPMSYANGRYQITFNGEIYNYLELKTELQNAGVKFVSESDTEVLLALYHQKKEKCLDDLDGMFAFALWDNKERRLFCARDRFGEKPFYYAIHDATFYFASEMKALWAVGVPRTVNNRMLFNYLTNGYVYNPHDLTETFFSGISKLRASHYFYVTAEYLTPKEVRYWDIDPDLIDDGISEDEACERFRELFDTSVTRRLRSDVPVGSSLSGGLDSSLIVCTIDRLIKDRDLPQSTFSARFPNFAKDEGRFMDMVIERTNVDPHFVFPDEDGLVNDLDALFTHQEEPFGSASIFAQFCVMRLAKECGVTVLMDGQGADELLAGYPFYFEHYTDELKVSDRPRLYRERRSHRSLYPSNGNGSPVREMIAGAMPANVQTKARQFRQKLHNTFSPILDRNFFREYESSSFLADTDRPKTLNQALYKSCFGGSLEELLRYADRNSMAHSREIRLAFLSPNVATFLFSLPSHFKIRNGVTKFIMREAFADILPPAIRDRRDKIGYEPPQGKWLKDARLTAMMTSAESQLLANKTLHPDYQRNMTRFGASPAYAEHNHWKMLMTAKLLV